MKKTCDWFHQPIDYNDYLTPEPDTLFWLKQSMLLTWMREVLLEFRQEAARNESLIRNNRPFAKKK